MLVLILELLEVLVVLVVAEEHFLHLEEPVMLVGMIQEALQIVKVMLVELEQMLEELTGVLAEEVVLADLAIMEPHLLEPEAMVEMEFHLPLMELQRLVLVVVEDLVDQLLVLVELVVVLMDASLARMLELMDHHKLEVVLVEPFLVMEHRVVPVSSSLPTQPHKYLKNHNGF